ncbi:hypothetical protein BCAR13_1110001 [Paraburkholderia caribensis]|nr:hypothetical protein BCAR13_1110001 [Paraburkholderia caribensis]
MAESPGTVEACLSVGVVVVRASAICFCFRGHPRIVSVLQASPVGVLGFALASAIR